MWRESRRCLITDSKITEALSSPRPPRAPQGSGLAASDMGHFRRGHEHRQRGPPFRPRGGQVPAPPGGGCVSSGAIRRINHALGDALVVALSVPFIASPTALIESKRAGEGRFLRTSNPACSPGPAISLGLPSPCEYPPAAGIGLHPEEGAESVNGTGLGLRPWRAGA